MTKPMYCPMKFNNPCCDIDEVCTPDCAWAIKFNGSYYCAVAFSHEGDRANSRPLEDDDE